jgi:gas vesicle protein
MVMRDMLIGAGIGAALAYMADPRTGRRRRALARDQFVRATRKTRDALDATARDLANRTSGIVASARGRWTDERVSDGRLTERVRAVLGRISSHPRAIHVYVNDGVVSLTGPVFADEVTGLVEAVCDIRGVQTVDNNLTVYSSAEGVPSLQGAGSVAEPSLDILQSNWAPATQALVAAAGLATAVCIANYARRVA